MKKTNSPGVIRYFLVALFAICILQNGGLFAGPSDEHRSVELNTFFDFNYPDLVVTPLNAEGIDVMITDRSHDVTSYVLERLDGATWNAIAEFNDLDSGNVYFFTDEGLQPGKVYTYAVTATTGDGSVYEHIVQVSARTFLDIPILRRSDHFYECGSKIVMEIDYPTEGASTQIFRATNADGPFTIVATLPPFTSLYTDDPNPRTTYFYKARAVADTVTSDFSAAFTWTAPSDYYAPGFVITNKDGGVQIVLTDRSFEDKFYHIERYTDEGDDDYVSFGNIVLSDSGQVHTIMDTNVFPGKSYTYVLSGSTFNYCEAWPWGTDISTLSITTPTAAAHISVDPDSLSFNDDSSFALNITNTGDARLYYTASTSTSFRTFHNTAPTAPNSQAVSPGPADINAIHNTAAYSLRGSRYGRNWGDCFYCLSFAGDGWQVPEESWELVGPFPYSVYVRGLSDGSGVPKTLFTPRVVKGGEPVSSFSMNVNLKFTTGSTWQIIPQSLTTGKIVTRLQVNPDHTFQVLVSDGAGGVSFQHVNVILPDGNFSLIVEVDRNTSLFSVYFNDVRVFTGLGFSNEIEQVAVLSLMETDGPVMIMNEMQLDNGHSLVLINEEDSYGDYVIDMDNYLLLHTVSGYVEPGATIDRVFNFFTSDLVPGVYLDSVRITTNDPNQPVLFVPLRAVVSRPYQNRADYVNPGKLEVTHTALDATVTQGDSATITFTVHNTGPFQQALYYPAPVIYDHDYRGYSRGSQNFQWTDIRATGTPLSLGDDDSQNIHLPFVFPYGWITDTEYVSIGSNGYLKVGTERADSPDNLHFLYLDMNLTNTIAPYWDNLVPNESSSIHYQMDDQKLIVQYTNVPISGHTEGNTFQVILYKSGAIKFQYLEMHDRQGASVGMGFFDGDKPLGLAFNQAFVTDSLAILFQYSASAIIDDEGSYTYVMYPWIHYPAGGSISIPPFSTVEIPVTLKGDAPGFSAGNVILFSRAIYEGSEPSLDQYDAGAFAFPVTLNVIESYQVKNFSLVNSVTNEVLLDFADSVSINPADPNFSKLAIRANTVPATVGSVKFKIDGSQTNIDNTNPYLLKNGVLTNLSSGAHALLAEPFTEASGHGQRRAGKTAVINVLNSGPVVVNFSLINSSTGQVISNFDSDLVLDKARYDFKDLNIRANTSPAVVGSVKFAVNGSQKNIDNSSPFMLISGTLQSLTGQNTFSAEPFTGSFGSGTRGVKKEISVTLIDASSRIVDFSLINTVNGEVVMTFDQSLTLNRNTADLSHLVIRANTSPSSVGSVKFKMDNVQTNIDNSNPYMMSQAVLASLQIGAHLFSAEPFSQSGGHGERGERREITLTIQDTPVVTSFSLINFVTGEILQNFETVLTLNTSSQDLSVLSVKANTTPSTVGSVKFKINGLQRNIDNSVPYMLTSSTLASLAPGEYVLFAEPFTDASGHGVRGQSLQATISLMANSPAPVQAGVAEELRVQEQTIRIYPVPVYSTLTVSVVGGEFAINQFIIVNSLGQEVYRTAGASNNLREVEVDTNALRMPAGVYYVYLFDTGGHRTIKKIMKE